MFSKALNSKMDLNTVVQEIYREPRRVKIYRPVIVKGLRDLVQADLIDFYSYAKFNRNIRYILIAINVFSKKLYCEALKDKKAITVSRAFEKILNRMTYIPRYVQTDRGSEFKQVFQNMLQRRGIHWYATFSTTKAQTAERAIRTLRKYIDKDISRRRTNGKFIDDLQRLVLEVNNKIHSKIKMKPIDVKPKHEKHLLETVYNYDEPFVTVSRFKVGDPVRIVLSKESAFTWHFYNPTFSVEIFKVRSIRRKAPITYRLSSFDGNEEIKGSFYERELLKTKNTKNVQFLEKVVKKGKNGWNLCNLYLNPNPVWVHDDDLKDSKKIIRDY